VASFIPHPPYRCGESPRYALNMGLGGPQRYTCDLNTLLGLSYGNITGLVLKVTVFPSSPRTFRWSYHGIMLQVSMSPRERRGEEDLERELSGLEHTVVCSHELKTFATQGRGNHLAVASVTGREGLLFKRSNSPYNGGKSRKNSVRVAEMCWT